MTSASSFHNNIPTLHPTIKKGKKGILLVNLGTPDAPTPKAIRKYLGEFLSDKRVIELSPVLWKIILNCFILPFRPLRISKAYQAIWHNSNCSPLLFYTQEQANKISTIFESNQNIVIDYAMRYGNPSIKSKIKSLKAQGCDHIGIFALYPQYSATTTATAYDEVFKVLARMRWQPSIFTFPPYHDNPTYIQSLQTSLSNHLNNLTWKPDRIIASYHGLPKLYLEKGDPYHCHCLKTTRLLGEAMNIEDETILITTFQSRFGKAEWLQPYTDKTIVKMAQEGIKNLVVIMPGFASDCIETLEEIGIGVKEIFLKHGGENFSIVPCLNDSDIHIKMIIDLISQELGGWLEK